MTYVDNESVDALVKELIGGVIEPLYGVLNVGQYMGTDEQIKSLIGRYLGIRTEDGQQRLYEVSLIEGEPYVMDA